MRFPEPYWVPEFCRQEFNLYYFWRGGGGGVRGSGFKVKRCRVLDHAGSWFWVVEGVGAYQSFQLLCFS